jgi:glycosyltransferase involved in cell wall biosynthesis
MPPLVSVVTPSLDQGRFLADAIESVIAQGYEPVEHLIVEGGSTDETESVLDRYRDRITVIEERPRLGQAHAVNLGFQAARGEIVGWLNADDRYVPGAFRTVVQAFADAPEIDVVFGNWEEIDTEGQVVERYRARPYDTAEQLQGINLVAQPTVFVRRPLFERIGYLDESLHFVMDYELWLRASRVTELRWLDSTLAQFRIHDASKTTSQWLGFWPESRRVARAYGGPYFSRGFRLRYLNFAYAKEVGGRALRRVGLRR